MANDNRLKLFKALDKAGFDIGSYDDFDRRMNNAAEREKFYTAVGDAGFDIGDRGEFERRISPSKYKLKRNGQLYGVSEREYKDFLSGGGKIESQISSAPWQQQSVVADKSQAKSKASSRQPSGISYGAPFRKDLSPAEHADIERQNGYASQQLQQMRDTRKKEEARKNQPIVDTGDEHVNQYLVKTQGQWMDEANKGISELGDKYISPMVDKAIDDMNNRFIAYMKESSKYVKGESDPLFDLRHANEAADPDKVLTELQKSLSGIYGDKKVQEDIDRQASRLGIDREEYIEDFVTPSLQERLAQDFSNSMVAQNMPKNAVEYVLNGLGESIAGMLTSSVTSTKSQRAYKAQADAMTEAGENPYYQPSTGAKLTKMGISFAADAPFFGLYGRVSGQVAKKVAEREIQKMVAKGLSENAARSIVGTALENSVGARMKNYLMQHVISSSLTMGAYNATSESARQIRDDDFNPLQIAASTGEGMLTGAAFGVTGAASQALTQPLTGILRVGGKVAGFGAEAETMYATEELAKMAHGEEGFTNPFEGGIEAVEKLGVMKLSGGHLPKKAVETIRSIGTNGLGKTVSQALSAKHTGVKFDKDEEAYIRESADGKNLLQALSSMHPEVAVTEIKGKRKLTKEGERLRENLVQSYNDFMNNPETPATLKQKVAHVLGGVYRPGLETGADIVYNMDGSVILKTRDKDGNCIRDLKFDSSSEAHEWRDTYEDEFALNDAVNMWNGTTVDRRRAIVEEVAETYGVNVMEANKMLTSALNKKDSSLDRDTYRYIFGIVGRNAYPRDEYNPARRYEEGRKISPEERHLAKVDVQLAEEQLGMIGEDFASEIKESAGNPDAKMAELAGRDGVTKEELEAARDYYNATAKLNGLMDETLKGVDERVAEANATVARNTHPDSGALIETTIDGRAYYVTAGHFDVVPDGRLSMRDKSGMIVLRAKDNGDIEVKSPQEVIVSGISDPNRVMAENDSMDGLRGQLMKEADDSIELAPGTPEAPENGDYFYGDDGKRYIALAMEDEAGNEIWQKVEVNDKEEPVGKPQPFDIDEFRRSKSDEIDIASEEESGVKPVDAERMTEEPVTDRIEEETPNRIEEETPDRIEEDPSSAIPVDEKGAPIYEQAQPEVTLSELTKKYGAERTKQLVKTMADNNARLYEELLEEDTSKMTDMAELTAHEDRIADAKRKMDYWNSLVQEDVTAEQPVESVKDEAVNEADAAPKVGRYGVNNEKVGSATVDDYGKLSPLTESGRKYYTENPDAMRQDIAKRAEVASRYLNGQLSDKEYLAERGYERQWIDSQAPDALKSFVFEDVDKIRQFLTDNGEEKNEPITPEQPQQPVVTNNDVVDEQPQYSEQQKKVLVKTARANVGRTISFSHTNGSRTELDLKRIDGQGNYVVDQRTYDDQGNLWSELKDKKYSALEIADGILKNTWKPVKTIKEKLVDAIGNRLGGDNIIQVLTDEEAERLMRLYEAKDEQGFKDLFDELRRDHFEDLIELQQVERASKAENILSGGGKTADKIRKLRRLYEGFPEAEMYLSDELLEPSPDALDEFVAINLGDVPKAGTGTLAYYSYGEGGNRVVGLQDESGFGKRGVNGDTKGFNPWLAPNGRGISLARYAENMHEYLPEALKERYSVQDVRNALIEVLTSAERPSDIPNYVLRRRMELAEQETQRVEQEWMESDMRYQKKRGFADRLEGAINETNTEPTDAQKKAGNYKKGHVSFGGYDFVVENPRGSKRRGIDADGNAWENEMGNTYGYILGKRGKDGDHLDMFINDDADLDNWDGRIYVVDQVNQKTGEFDEHKIMYGFDSEAEAREAYLRNYGKDWQGLGRITGVDKDTFDKWLDSSDRKVKAFGEHSIVKSHMVERGETAFDSALKQLDEREISIDNPDLLQEYGLRNVTLSRLGDHVTLTHFVAAERGQGNGTRFMEDLSRMADERGWTLALTPDTSFGASSVSRLKKFYKRFGFKDNKGRNTDFYTSESMIRRPKEWQPSSPGRRELSLRDAVIDHLREKGVNVSDDWQEGQRILDEYNGNGQVKKMTVRKNIENGMDALQRIADGEESVPNAMTRDDLSQYGGDNNITFYYGKTGNPEKNYKGGYGIAHIGGKHGADTLLRVLNVIADGKIDRYVPGNKTVVLTDGEYEAVLALTRFGEKETWLFSGWKKDEKTGADGEVSTHSDATQANPTFSREDLGAVLSDAKVRNILGSDVKKDENFSEQVDFHKVSDAAELTQLEKGPTVKRYRAMQLIDGKLYPPMSAKVDGQMRQPTEIGVWEKAEERPDLIKNGKFVLNKGQKGQGSIPAAYNPYFHTSTSGLNDQFTSAYKRPELVVVEVEIPESELTSGYKAEGAKDAVGNVDWHSGVVNGQLPADRQRQVTLSRYNKVTRIVPDSEVADMIAKQLEGTGIEVPYNVVTPAQRAELEKRGVKISSTPAGKVTEDINGNPIKEQKVDGPVFVSNALKAVEGIKQEKATPEQWLKMIEKNGGLKAGEDKWMGLSEWLKGQDKKSLTKQEVLDFIRENQIQIEEVNYADQTLGRYDEHWDYLRTWLEENTDNPDAWYNTITENYGYRDGEGFSLNQGTRMPKQVTDMVDRINKSIDKSNPINSTRLSYTTKGLENKKEIALVVPTIESWNMGDAVHFGDAGNGRAVAWVRFGETTDADGKKVLVIDEIQSKRHQEGREKGYGDPAERKRLYDEKMSEYRKRTEAIKTRRREYLKKVTGNEKLDIEGWKKLRQEDKEYLTSLNRENDALLKEQIEWEKEFENTNSIPDAPFEKNWHELAMKRMLRYAAENGYDKVAWTKGEQQAERYDIGNTVKKIISYDYPSTADPDGRKSKKMEIRLTNGETMTMRVNEEGKVVEGSWDTTGKNLSDVVGKDLAVRIMGGEGKDGTIFDANKDLPAKVIEGEGLRIGGEGMKGFYDQMLPRFMDKYGKKWGVKTGEVELPNVEEAGRKMWSVDVTPEMKESVMEGQPMFFKTRDGHAYGYTYKGKIYIDPRIATSETPVHEYSHLWAEMKRQTSPEEWEDVKRVMLTDKMVQPIIEKVKREYPELTKEGKEDDFIEEIITQFSGKRGSERLREIANEIAAENGGVFGKAEAVTAMQRLKNILNHFWAGVAKMMGWKYRNANQIADRIMADMLNGVNPRERMRAARDERRDMRMGERDRKQSQLDIINENNPADESLGEHTWIKSVDDIKNFDEAMSEYGEDENLAPDYTAEMARKAKETGEITVYSSKPIGNGIFVTPSKMEAKNYAGEGRVYSKRVRTSDVAWIDGMQGQYAKVDEAKMQKVDGDIHSDNFKNFFGDWEKEPENASKVVDKNGKPLVVQHGTGDEFYTFDIGQLGKASGNKGWFGEGFYFTPWEDQARGYAKEASRKSGNPERLMPVYLNIRNPQVVDISERDSFVPEEGTDGVIVTITLPKGSPFRKKGVKFDKDRYIYEIKANSPNQIKSATENVGTYDPSNPDIRYQKAPSIELNVATARDKESRSYMKQMMAEKGLTEQESNDLMGIIDNVSDQVMNIAEKYPAFKRWQQTGIADDVDEDAYNAMWRIQDSKLGWIPNRSAFKKNGEYLLNIDLGTLCTKREAMDALMQIIVDKGGAQNLGPTQIEALKDLLKEEGFLTACDVCFVETKRARAINDANRFAYEWQSVLEGLGIDDDVVAGQRDKLTYEQMKRLAEMTGKDFKKAYEQYIPSERRRTKVGKEDLDAGITADKMKMIANLMVQDSTLVGKFRPEWLLTTKGTDWLFRTYGTHTDMGSVLAAMFGAATAKPLEGFNIYDPLSWRKDFDAKKFNEEGIYSIGGFRAQSFTDFNPILFMDYVQMFSDLAIRRLPMHIYTKVPSLIKLFGETGSMFNMSLVPAMEKGVDRAHAGLKPDGKGGWDYAWADESFPVDEAMELRRRKEFGGRVGTIAVGVSDEHILKMLDDENIDMIIPYHKSGMPMAVQVKTGLEFATDYTNFQNTKDARTGKTVEYNYNEALQRLGDPRKAAQAYLDWCDKNGYTPKFSQFRDHKNYYKLLEDFRGYDNEGKPVLQGPVKLKLTKDWNEQLDSALADRGNVDKRISEMSQNEHLMEKASKLLQYQRMDGEVRTMMMNRLSKVLGKNNVQSLRQGEFFDALEKAYSETMSDADAHAKVEVLRSSDGRVYGFASNGKIVFNENLFNANTPAHEFTHVWVKVARTAKPKLWEQGKSLLKQSAEWQEVMTDSLYKDIIGDEDAVASEVLSRIVGKMNEDYVRSLLDPSQKQLKEKALYKRILGWLEEMFDGVRSLFDKSHKNLTFEEFIRMPLKDLWNDKNANQFKNVLKQVQKGSDNMVDTEVETDVALQAERTPFELSNDDAMRFQRVNPEPELTPEERQYWRRWEKDMAKWKERNGIAPEEDAPSERPTYQQGENAMDYAKRLVEYNKNRRIWETAPKIEDYERQRLTKDILEDAREVERRYPLSRGAKMRRVAAELQQIRQAVSNQKSYDKATVKAVTDFAQDFMKMGFADNLSRGEMERILSSVKNATGANDVKKHVDNILNVLVDNHLRNLDNSIVRLSSIKELRQTAQGVEKQGKLELKGQKMIQKFREARGARWTVEELREKVAEAADRMTSHPDSSDMWEQEWEGYSIALDYAESIDASRSEYASLQRDYKDAVSGYRDSGRSYQAQQQLLASIDQAMMDNKIERIGMYGNIIGRLQGKINESIEGAREFVEREKQRVENIHKIANYDLAGKEMGAMREKQRGKPANFFLQPLGTFEQMLKQFGGRNATGEGYLYNHFVRSWMDATDQAVVNEERAKEELDAKAREVFGKGVKRWSDLYEISRRLPTMDVDVLDGEQRKTFTLTQGNLMYIYMADKMTDGRMKLRKMGITESDVNDIKEFLDPRLVELADWLQDDYLVKKRADYNKVHERMFGASMAAIDHYFPLKILGDARVQEQDVANMVDQDAVLPSTITGNIIKRRRNSLPLDVLHTDALSLAIEHVEDMERWAATAEWNRDINTLLSYTTFRNKVKNMKTIYGSGDALWNKFADTARMAAGTYNPKAKPGSVDAAISNIAKGVTAAKINFRVYTAFKQLLSAPAFVHDVRIDDFVKNGANPYGSWKWAMENMPVFRKRWRSRQAGDTRLMDDPTDWKLWKNNVVQLATRLGMTPNGFVDGVTCAVGAKSIYESRYRKYKEIGASDEIARKRALQDAEIGYNLTQQSSEGAFVSAIQKDRTVAANMLSVFRNSSMAYTRQWVDAARNLKHRTQRGYKEDSIHFMAGQMMEQFGLEKEDAMKAAESAYARAGRHEVAKMLNMMFGVTIAWNLGASLPYLLIGDDDNTKKEMLKDAFIRGMIAGPVEGLAGGNLFSEFISRSAASEETRNTIRQEGWGAGIDAAIKQGGDYEVNPLPLMADIQGMIKKMGYDKYAAAQDVFNICMQSAVGVNPQTFTDMFNACMDYGAPGWDGVSYHGDFDNFKRPKEIALFMLRLMNAPTSSWRNKYIDELGMNAEDAQKLPYDEMARRYAHYKHWKDAPVMGWLRGEEGRAEKIEKMQQQFDKAVEERIGRLTDSELMHNVARSQSYDERRMLAKVIAKRLGFDGSATSGKASQDWQKNYQMLMEYDDIREDELLQQKKSEAKERGDKTMEKLIEDVQKRIRDKGKKKLGDGDDDAVMDNIRQWRKTAIEKVMRRENATSGGHYDERGVFVYDDWRDAPEDGEPSQKERRRKK